MRRSRIARGRLRWWLTPVKLIWLVLSTGVVLLATLTPSDGPVSIEPIACLTCGERWVADGLVNVLMFVPVGSALALLGVGWSGAGLLGLALSSAVELAQLDIPGRAPVLRDVLANGAGAALGATLVALGRAWTRRIPLRAFTPAMAAGAVALACVTGSHRLAAPDLDGEAARLRWGPARPGSGPAAGRLSALSIGPTALPDGPARASRFMERLRSGVPLHLEIDRARSPASAVLLTVSDDSASTLLTLEEVDGGSLTVRYRSRAEAYGLLAGRAVVPGVLAGAPEAERARVSVYLSAGGACAVHAGRTRCARFGEAGSGWALLHDPLVLPGVAEAAHDVVWLALLFAPLGVLTPAAAVPAGFSGLLAATILAVASLVSVPLTASSALLGAMSGALAGEWLQRALADR